MYTIGFRGFNNRYDVAAFLSEQVRLGFGAYSRFELMAIVADIQNVVKSNRLPPTQAHPSSDRLDRYRSVFYTRFYTHPTRATAVQIAKTAIILLSMPNYRVLFAYLKRNQRDTLEHVQKFDFSLEDQKCCTRFALSCVMNPAFVSYSFLSSLDIRAPADRLRVVLASASHRPEVTAREFKHFGVTAQSHRIQVAQGCIGSGNPAVICHVPQFGIISKMGRYDLAVKSSKLSPAATLYNLRYFELGKELTVRFVLQCIDKYAAARLAFKRDIGFHPKNLQSFTQCQAISMGFRAIVRYFVRLDFTDPKVIESIVRQCARVDAELTAKHFKNFGIDPRSQVFRYEIARILAQQDPWATAAYMPNLGITEEAKRTLIAFLCAEKDSKHTRHYLAKFRLSNKESLAKLNRIFTIQLTQHRVSEDKGKGSVVSKPPIMIATLEQQFKMLAARSRYTYISRLKRRQMVKLLSSFLEGPGAHCPEELIHICSLIVQYPSVRSYYYMTEVLGYILTKHSEFRVYMEPKNSILTSASGRVLIRCLQNKYKGHFKLDIQVCDTREALETAIHGWVVANKCARAGFIVKHPVGHRSAVFVQKTMSSLSLLALDSTSAPDYARSLTSMMKAIGRKVPGPSPTVYLSNYWRQVDTANCLVFALNDLVEAFRHPDIIAYAERNSRLNQVGVRVLTSLPLALLKTTQSFQRLDTYIQALDTRAADCKLVRQVRVIDSRRPTSTQDVSTSLLDLVTRHAFLDVREATAPKVAPFVDWLAFKNLFIEHRYCQYAAIVVQHFFSLQLNKHRRPLRCPTAERELKLEVLEIFGGMVPVCAVAQTGLAMGRMQRLAAPSSGAAAVPAAELKTDGSVRKKRSRPRKDSDTLVGHTDETSFKRLNEKSTALAEVAPSYPKASSQLAAFSLALPYDSEPDINLAPSRRMSS